MIYVGIDVASTKHDVCITSNDLEVYGKIFQINNTESDYKKLLAKINEAKKFFKDSKVRIGIESTGVYSSTILNFCSISDFEVIFINPILTNMFQLSTKVHYAKTDKIDAKGICRFLSRNQDYYTYTPPSYHIIELKSLFREYTKCNKFINMIKNDLIGKVHKIFPEFLTLFPNLKGSLPMYLLEKYTLPSDYKGKHKDTLLTEIRNAARGHYEEDDVNYLLNIAATSIGSYSECDRVIILQLIAQIEVFQKAKKALASKMVELTKTLCPNLLSIPGVGAITAAGIYGEIGNIDNFKNADSLLAYAGLNPIVYESGNYKATQTKISKKGSSYLRNAIMTAARIIRLHDETFNNYYNKKKEEGKSYNCIIGHISKKLVRVIYHILKNNVSFKPQTISN